VRETLPEGFQRSEFLLRKGMLDDVVPRPELKARLATYLRLLLKKPMPEPSETERAAVV